MGLEYIGVTLDPRGWIVADERMQTGVPGVYAVGDVLGPSKVMLAHVAYMEGAVAAENAAGGGRSMDYGVVPGAIFTMPEVANVGLTEAQAREQGFPVRSDTVLFRTMGKAQVTGEHGRRGQDRLRCRNGQNSGGPHGWGPCHRSDRGRNARLENAMHGEGSGRNHPCASDTGGSDAGGIFQSNGHVFARVIGHGPGIGRSQYVWETGQVAFKSGAKDQPRAPEQITGFWELSIGRG